MEKTRRRNELNYKSDLQRVESSLLESGTQNDHKFHIQNHELDRVEEWVTELLDHSKKAAKAEKKRTQSMEGHNESSVDFMKEQVQRYSTISQELVRQISSHNPQLARLMAKAWTGIYSVTKGLIDNYEGFVGRCTGIENQMQRRIKESDHKIDVWRHRIEDTEFQQMVTNANLRSREADIETLTNRIDEVEAENRRLRRLVGMFIEGRDPDDKVANQYARAYQNGNHPYPTAMVGHIGQRRVKDLYELDDRVSEIMSKVTREGQKQQKILTDMQLLFSEVGIDSYHMNKLIHKKVDQKDVEIQTEATEDVLQDLLANMSIATNGGKKNAKEFFKEMPPDRVIKPRGSQIPYELRALMETFPATKRIPAEHAVSHIILEIYIQRLYYEEERPSFMEYSMAEFLYAMYKKRYGDTLVDQQLSQLVLACSHYKDNKRIKLFGTLLGVNRGDKPPLFSKRDARFLLDFMKGLTQQGELSKNMLQGYATEVPIDLVKVISVIRNMFWGILPDSGNSFLTRVQFMTSGDPRTNKAIDFDDLMEVVAQQWMDVQELWKKHLRHLFESYCTTYQVEEEMQFAHDKIIRLGAAGGPMDSTSLSSTRNSSFTTLNSESLIQPSMAHVPSIVQIPGEDELAEYSDKDSVLIEISKEDAKNKPRRPLRNVQALIQESIQKRKTAALGTLSIILDDESVNDMGNPGIQVRKSKGRSREVVALLDKTNFTEVIKRIVPGLPYEKIMDIFQRCCEIMQHSVISEFERIWIKEVQEAEGGSPKKIYYCNIYSNESQWTRPYNPENFMSDDVDLDSFIKACLDCDLMQKSPFVKIFNKTPEDFVTNWEAYYHQVKDGTLSSHYQKNTPNMDNRGKKGRKKSIIKISKVRS